jgi:hypothetical protein
MAFDSPVSFSFPAANLFSIPPTSAPDFITPPAPGSGAFAPPVYIPDSVYQAVLDPKVPVTIAAVYAITAKALNVYNKSTGKKPWAISKTTAFKWFVIAHNVFLAIYSAWTFVGMLGALRRTVVSPFGPTGLSGFADSMCRMNGPPGLGNAALYDDATGSWFSYAGDVSLDAAGIPTKDFGRLWNEGLAFYGWIFYLSKFYEVLDTLIILAKGKLSSTLQTYHHAGAMMCMWAGMRYMSAPIWLFVFVNSGIHAMMYTYYTVTAFNIRVPMFIKRTLTTCQITQFLVGGSYAMLHSFVSYSIPVAQTSTQGSTATASAVAGTNGSATGAAVIDSIKGDITYKTVPCISNNGATLAVWLNVFYLTPLTYLFVSFFIESYLRRSNAAEKKGAKKNGVASRRLSNNVAMAEKAGWEAAKNVEREVYGESNEEAIASSKKNGRALRSHQ